MSFDGHANFALGPVATAPEPAISGLSLVLQAGVGALMPVPPFNATVWPEGQPTKANAEIVRVESIVGDAVELSARVQEGTTAKKIEAGWLFADTITAKALTDVEEAVTAETARAIAAEATKASTGSLAAETVSRETGDSANAGAISTEKSRAEGVEATKATTAALNSEIVARETAVSGEATTRAGADTALTTSIATEKTRAEGAEATKASTASLTAETTAREAADALRLAKSENLKDIGSASTARTNLGLGSAAVEPSSAFDPKGAASSAEAAASTALAGEKTRAETQEGLKLAKTENLKDVSSASTARTNLGLGTAAVEPSTAFDAKGAAASAQAAAEGVTATEKTRAEAAEVLKAPLASPALTGSPTAPTQTPGDNSTKLATTAFSAAAVAVEKGRAETAEATKASSASLTSETSAREAADATNATAISTEKTRAEGQEVLKAPLASPALTGTPTVPTATAGTNTTQAASTAFATTAKGEAESKGTTALNTEKSRAEAAEGEAVKLTGIQTVAGSKTFSSPPIVPTPNAPNDAVSLEYMQGLLEGITPYANVVLATAAALPANAYSAGVLTGVSFGALTIDGTTPVVGQRVLVKNETTEANNGIYTVTHVGAVAELYALTRASDMAAGATVKTGALTYATAGATNANKGFWVVGLGPFTVATNSLKWEPYLGSQDIVAGEGISVAGNVLSVTAPVLSSAQFYVNVKDHGAKGDGTTDDAAAIEAAQKFAEEQPGNYGVFFPAGTYLYGSTLKLLVPWYGVGRKSILKHTSTFTYSGFNNQFCILNSHFGTTYNAGTADTIHLESVDLEMEGAPAEKKSGLGFANIAGGEIKDCQIRTKGTNIINGPLYIYASVRNLLGVRLLVENSTEASQGASAFIQNLTSEPASLTNATENIRFRDSIFINNSADEAVAIYGARGMTRNVRIESCLLEDRASATAHQAIFSAFPLSKKGEFANAAVEDIIAIDCTFRDVEETCEGDMIRVGATEDAEAGKEAVCQNVRIINPSIYAKTGKAGNIQSVMRNIICKFDGPFSGCKVINPYINTKGSSQAWNYALKGWGNVENPSVVGNNGVGLNECSRVLGGEVECSSRGAYNCGKVSGLQLKLSVETGTACYLDNANSAYVSFSDCTVVGGQRLLLATVGAHNTHVDLKGTEMTPASANKVVIETPTPAGEAPLRLRVLNCTIVGTTTLTRAEYILGNSSQSEFIGNEWFGTIDSEGVQVSGKLDIPNKVKIYKTTGSAETTEFAGGVDSGTRELYANTLILTSATPIIGLERVPPFFTVNWIAWYTTALEATPANREHLWVALLNPSLETIGVSADYTSATNTPLAASALRGLLLTTPWKNGSEWTYVRPLLVEKVSSGNPITVGTKEAAALVQESPALCGTGNAAQTVPGSLPSPVTLTATAKRPFFVLG